jgi:hypothetical protein
MRQRLLIARAPSEHHPTTFPAAQAAGKDSLPPVTKNAGWSAQGETLMTYTQPEVTLLGDARTVIESLSTIKGGNRVESYLNHNGIAAYDLDD